MVTVTERLSVTFTISGLLQAGRKLAENLRAACRSRNSENAGRAPAAGSTAKPKARILPQSREKSKRNADGAKPKV